MALGRSNSLSINTGVANTAPSLFGGSTINTQQPASNSSLFGQQPANKPTSIFGGTQTQQQPAASSLFPRPPTNQSQNSTLFTTPFGNSSAQPQNIQQQQQQQQPQQQAQAPSLLGATMRAQNNQAAPFGRLSMGQGNPAQSTTIGGVKIDLDNLRATTRFDDCIDLLREQLEGLDRMIQTQEAHAREIEAILPKHAHDVGSLAPDVELVRDKAKAVEQALIADAGGVEAQRGVAAKDKQDFERCQRVVTLLTLPRQYHYSGGGGPMAIGGGGGAGGGGGGGVGAMYGGNVPASSQQQGQQGQRGPAAGVPGQGEPVGVMLQTNVPLAVLSHDTDLVGGYFMPLATELQSTVDGYRKNLSEIEGHMGVVEASAVAQAQTLAQRRSGMTAEGGESMGDNTVRELADTLLGFEQSILGIAGAVGECREGVNELLLGRLA